MTSETLSKAHEAIGAFFCAFSNLERELGKTIKVVLRLREHPAADAIVGLVGDFARKANIVREAIQGAKLADGSDPSEDWKANADEIMGQRSPGLDSHDEELGSGGDEREAEEDWGRR